MCRFYYSERTLLRQCAQAFRRKVPPNNPVSMQLSALQKLEVVSHADCRACLFTSLSIQMIDVGLDGNPNDFVKPFHSGETLSWAIEDV